MNVSPVSFNQISKVQSFKGTEDKKEAKGQISPDAAAIKESIDKNTAALEAIAEQVNINSYTLYAIEKSKSGSEGFHRESYGDTDNPESFVRYVNRHWRTPRY